MPNFDWSKPRVILLTGIMAAGKSTVAQQLAERLPRSVHLRGDVFRRMIVSGQAEMTADLSAEARSQLSLRYTIAATTASLYLGAGFSVVYQDIILGDDLNKIVQLLIPQSPYVVVLCPNIEAVAAREAGRLKSGYGDMPIAAFDEELRLRTPKLGLWLDTSQQTPSETADEILARLDEAQLTNLKQLNR